MTSETLKRLAKPFFDQGETKLYVALGCGRIYVAPIPSVKCKKCNSVHPNQEVSSMEDLDTIDLTIP